MSYRKLILPLSLIAFLVSFSAAQTIVERPAIVGVAHIGLRTDLAAARNFYGHSLGYQEPFTLDIETVNIQQLRDYLASRGVKAPDKLKLGLDGNMSMMIHDPDGHNVVQYWPVFISA